MRSAAATNRLNTTWRLLLKELGAFGVVGSACFVLDVGLFQLLYVHVGLGAVTSKLLSTLVSMTVAYVAHRQWSFSHRARTSVRREYLVFALVNGATCCCRWPWWRWSAIRWGSRVPSCCRLANVASIATGTVIRFLSYRRWVFVAHDHPAAVAAAGRTSSAVHHAA